MSELVHVSVYYGNCGLNSQNKRKLVKSVLTGAAAREEAEAFGLSLSGNRTYHEVTDSVEAIGTTLEEAANAATNELFSGLFGDQVEEEMDESDTENMALTRAWLLDENADRELELDVNFDDD